MYVYKERERCAPGKPILQERMFSLGRAQLHITKEDRHSGRHSRP